MRSFDGGATWTPFSLPAGAYEVWIAPGAGRTWYAFATDGFYRTVDGGQNWQLRTPPPADPLVATSLSISADADILYRSLAEYQLCEFICVTTNSRLQVSRDGGLSWRDIGAQTAFQRAFASPVDARLVFALGTAGLHRSTDYGNSWEPLTVAPAESATAIQYGELALDRQDSSIAYLRVQSHQPSAPVFSTRDRGQSWTSATLAPGDRLFPDPGQAGRAYLFAHFEGAFETRDAGLTWVHVEPFFNWSVNQYVDGITVRGGRRFGLNAEFLLLKELDLNDGALALRSDLWWDPAESGAGLTITHHGSNQTFVVWYGYEADGAPVWRVMPGGRWSDRTFTGDLFETSGPAYFGVAFDPARVVARRVGSAQIRFDNENAAHFSYQLASGEATSKRIVRQMFGVPVSIKVVEDNFADLWWNAGESGWGIVINHQHDNLFATWFVYDDQGRPLWIVMPDAKVSLSAATPRASGDIYTTRGPPSTGPFDPSKVAATKVGTASITFRSGTEALLEYTAFGRAESRTITRQPF